MIDINLWMESFIKSLKETFGERVYFVGLQGSYGRGEATDSSDIDVVVILDELTADDIKLANMIEQPIIQRKAVRICVG